MHSADLRLVLSTKIKFGATAKNAPDHLRTGSIDPDGFRGMFCSVAPLTVARFAKLRRDS